MSKNVAENNGLACESIWIPIDSGTKYRFTCKYHSTGPVPRLFLKGFGELADQFGDKKDPEAIRRAPGLGAGAGRARAHDAALLVGVPVTKYPIAPRKQRFSGSRPGRSRMPIL